jgi:hypothetical protein
MLWDIGDALELKLRGESGTCRIVSWSEGGD